MTHILTHIFIHRRVMTHIFMGPNAHRYDLELGQKQDFVSANKGQQHVSFEQTGKINVTNDLKCLSANLRNPSQF